MFFFLNGSLSMANFKTHISVAWIICMVITTVLLGAGLITKINALVYIALGTLGGILPDIDLGDTAASKIIFPVISVFFAYVLMFAIIKKTSILLSLLAWVAVFMLVRYGILKAFTKFTKHRGIVHSVPSGLLLCFMTAIVVYYGMGKSTIQAWSCGLFLSFGFFIHLLLDEIYSVDISGARMKKSFGTALTIFTYDTWVYYIILYAAVIVSFLATPDYHPLLNSIYKSYIWQQIHSQLLPW
ncbi:MAG: hypothetical protein COB50_00610 [Thiotrichales bacterium]|nr:MAG: hypothetical protein COB50_00610 [Thiotrichales bacterium]